MQVAEVSEIALLTIKEGPIRHPTLPDDLVGRIRLVRACLLGVYTDSMDSWLDGFQRDTHPSQEVAHWEHVAAVYHEYVSMTPEIQTSADSNAVFNYINLLWIGDENALALFLSKLPSTAPKVIGELYKAKLPVYDTKELRDEYSVGRERDQSSDLENVDKERFPQGLPDDLIAELSDRKRKKIK
jgi:hypothetical protein